MFLVGLSDLCASTSGSTLTFGSLETFGILKVAMVAMLALGTEGLIVETSRGIKADVWRIL